MNYKRLAQAADYQPVGRNLVDRPWNIKVYKQDRTGYKPDEDNHSKIFNLQIICY